MAVRILRFFGVVFHINIKTKPLVEQLKEEMNSRIPDNELCNMIDHNSTQRFFKYNYKGKIIEFDDGSRKSNLKT